MYISETFDNRVSFPYDSMIDKVMLILALALDLVGADQGFVDKVQTDWLTCSIFWIPSRYAKPLVFGIYNITGPTVEVKIGTFKENNSLVIEPGQAESCS